VAPKLLTAILADWLAVEFARYPSLHKLKAPP